jgi:hypothetical protein
MRKICTLHILLVMSLSAFVAGCLQESGRVYKEPMAEAHRMLRAAGLPPIVFGTDMPDSVVDASDPSKVVWIVKKNGKEMLRMVAELTPVSAESTRVRVSAVGATEGPFGNVADKLVKNPTVANLYVAGMEERVAATLEDRDFQITRIYPAITAAGVANIGTIHQAGQRAIAAGRKRDSDNIAKAYANEAR